MNFVFSQYIILELEVVVRFDYVLFDLVFSFYWQGYDMCEVLYEVWVFKVEVQMMCCEIYCRMVN